MRPVTSVLGGAALAALVSASAAAAPAPVAAPTGRLGAVMEYDPGRSPSQTVYRPRDMGAARDLPIVAWGNGACADNGGANARFMLMELASQGYVIIAPGRPGPDPELQPTNDRVPPPAPPPAPGATTAAPAPGEDATQASQLIAAIDWAIQENGRQGSVYFGKLAPAKVAVMGHSCGGLQALAVQDDPRIVTTMIWNSGIYNRPGGRSGVRIAKDQLGKIHAPIAYVLGGPTDIAYENGTDDYARITGVPTALMEANVGHGGTFRQANGGTYAKIAKAWLDWRLKGDTAAAAMFTGPNCTLCANADWKLSRKGM